jgi:hypothetical protein
MKKVSDKNSSKQRTCHYTQANTAKLQPPDQVSDSDGQVNGHFRVFREHTA